jgi:hypothetical protein
MQRNNLEKFAMNGLCHTVLLDDADYKCVFDFQPHEKPNYNLESSTCGPGCAAEVEITAIEIRPHGYSNWIPTDVALWNKAGNAWDYLESECLESTLREIA